MLEFYLNNYGGWFLILSRLTFKVPGKYARQTPKNKIQPLKLKRSIFSSKFEN